MTKYTSKDYVTMTKYTSLAIALTATTFLSAPAIAASLTPTLEENSVFAYSEGSENDYNFTLQEADADGQLSTKYYKIDLKPEQFTTSKSISWAAVGEDQKDAADVVEVELPNDQVKYLKYTYTQPEGRTVYNTRQSHLSSDDKITIDADFIGSYDSPHHGGAFANYGTFGNITGNFIGNDISWIYEGSDVPAIQGGAIENLGTIGDITGDFIGNLAIGTQKDTNAYVGLAFGGAIYQFAGTINNINGNFINNVAQGEFAKGGAIFNSGIVHDDFEHLAKINNITGNFIGNRLTGVEQAFGGAIYNDAGGIIGNITGDFIDNSSNGTRILDSGDISKYGLGGAVYNSGAIKNIKGDFINNNANYVGGAIFNTIMEDGNGHIETITGNFIGNYADDGYGGAINNQGIISRIKSDFVNNFAGSGGAISNELGTIDSITGNFIGNKGEGFGGAICNINHGKIGALKGDFIKNHAAHGGAIHNDGDLFENISGNFIDNYAGYSGGAINTATNISFSSGDDTFFFSNNYVEKNVFSPKKYNAILVDYEMASMGAPNPNPITVTFDTAGGGAWIINDNIEANRRIGTDEVKGTFVLNLTGDDTVNQTYGTTTQYIKINNDIIGADQVLINGTTLRFGSYQHEDKNAYNWDGKGAFAAYLYNDFTENHGVADRNAAAVVSLKMNNGVFDIANGYLETVKLKGYSATDSFLHIDVDVENMKADELHIAGDVKGVTKMIVHASSDVDIRNRGQILFAQSENDTAGNAGSFVVSRVYKSPYLFDVKYDQIAENSNKWSLEMNDQPNEGPKEPEKPDVPDVPSIKPQPVVLYRKVTPEVINAESLPAAALAQNSNMVYNIMNKVSANRLYCPGCGFYDYYWNGEAFHNLWANAVYNTLRIKTPTDIDAEVWGIEAGGDLQHDINNKLGLFLSYRKGNYDMNGDGKHHYSTIGSEIDIDSYLAGLYYRYDRNNWWGFATVYGGIQKADLKTKDGIKSDTDGVEFGGSVELGYDYAVNKTVYLTPSVGAFYTQVDYDDARDSAGKVAKYNTLRQLELEAGVKLTKAFVMDEGYANVYVKPSVVRTITDGDEVRITGLGKVNTLEDQTLGRIEVGGRYGFTEQLSAYGWANHTFGDDYKASTAGLGLSYNW